MILGAWQVLVLVGAGAAFHGFVRKGEGAVFTLLATCGCFAVAGLGSLSLEAEHTTSGEWGIAILFFTTATLAGICVPIALTKSGPYAEESADDEDREETDEFGESNSTFLDEFVRRMT